MKNTSLKVSLNDGLFQVTEETCAILQNFGYIFEQRGLVTVKGKGQLMTYYLIGKGPVGGSNPAYSTMETVREEEEEEEVASDQQALLSGAPVPTITRTDSVH